MIETRVPSGTRDILPPLAMQRQQLMNRLRRVFEQYGFVPIETPVLERREVLYAKGGQEVQRQVFEVAQRGQRLAESDLALRFDLTVPLARFMARHVEQIGVPFKRYQIGLVYRGERAQRGRFREFYQCDFDTIGPQSHVADAEIAMVIHDGLAAAGFDRFRLLLNSRQILWAALELFGLAEHSEHVLPCLDKLSKIGRDGVLEELQFAAGAGWPEPGTDAEDRTGQGSGTSGHAAQEVGDNRVQRRRLLEREQALRIVGFIEAAAGRGPHETLDWLQQQLGANERAEAALANLRAVCQLLQAAGIQEQRFAVDVSLARGLDYYTGIVFESTVEGFESVGSVCSGGRYDDLAGLFTERKLPGVGASFGLDRMLHIMAEAGAIQQLWTAAPVLIVWFPGCEPDEYVRMAGELRAADIACELYPEAASPGTNRLRRLAWSPARRYRRSGRIVGRHVRHPRYAGEAAGQGHCEGGAG